jgi:hypothetical protein
LKVIAVDVVGIGAGRRGVADLHARDDADRPTTALQLVSHGRDLSPLRIDVDAGIEGFDPRGQRRGGRRRVGRGVTADGRLADQVTRLGRSGPRRRAAAGRIVAAALLALAIDHHLGVDVNAGAVAIGTGHAKTEFRGGASVVLEAQAAAAAPVVPYLAGGVDCGRTGGFVVQAI